MTPIATLIQDRIKQLGISRSELARRLGYPNISKGLRRIDSIIAGDLHGAEKQLALLPIALEVEPAVVATAVEAMRRDAEEVRQRLAAAHEQAWRASFRPHAIVLTERTVPSQITICGMVRGDRFRWIDLDLTQAPATYIRQAMRVLNQRLITLKVKELPFWGPATGYAVNLTPDRCVLYSLEGKAEAVLPSAYRMGRAQLTVSGSPLDPDELGRLLQG